LINNAQLLVLFSWLMMMILTMLCGLGLIWSNDEGL